MNKKYDNNYIIIASRAYFLHSGATVMALRLSTSSKNTRRLERDNNAKFAAPPQRPSAVMVRQARERNNWKVGGTQKAIYKQLQFNIQATNINRRNQSLHTEAQ
jgi:hypothetical protein